MVDCQGLTKSYGDFHAVRSLDLHVPSGGIYGFLGPNGAGKSTTMKLLLGLTRPTSGQVTVLGQDISAGGRVRPGQVGSLIEGPAFYPSLSAAENLQMMADYLGLPSSSVPHALDTVGLDSRDGKQAKHFSLGMKQRLGIAMALLSRPSLLLLDEPTNGLDPAGVAEIRHLIVALARQQGVTVLVSSHILSEIEQMADIVGIINQGRLRYEGPLSGLQDAGVLEFVANDVASLDDFFTARGVQHERGDGCVRTPMVPDAVAADLVEGIVRAGVSLYRVQRVHKTLEQAFLELTDPLNAEHDEVRA